MAIKAKIKARALGPLYMDLWLSFLAGKRDLGMDYLTKKFHTFPWFLGAQKCWWTVAAKMGAPFFWVFFHLQPLFPMENVNLFGIFFSDMIKAVFIPNQKSFAIIFY